MLVEKFDNGRIRLKRTAKARERDSKLEFDPYRTEAGVSQAAIVFVAIGIALGILVTIMLVAAIGH